MCVYVCVCGRACETERQREREREKEREWKVLQKDKGLYHLKKPGFCKRI